jgi:predicted acylesterase/phospholipase RssA
VSRNALGLVLSGGGARGAFHIGVHEVLLGDPRFRRGPAVFSGTSSGAINAALIAAGKSAEEMMEFWCGLAEDPPVAASEAFVRGALGALARQAGHESLDWLTSTRPLRAALRGVRRNLPPRATSPFALGLEYLLIERFDLVSGFLEALPAPAVVDAHRLRERLVAVFGGTRVETRHRLAVSAVDVRTGEVVRFVNARTPRTKAPEYQVVDAITVDMLMASASIPVLFPPVEVGRRLLWDGGLLVNTPLAPVVALGADRIVPVLVNEPAGEGPIGHLGEAIERALETLLENAWNVDRKLLLERNRTRGRGYRRVTLFKPLRPSTAAAFTAGSYLHFERAALGAIRAAGRRAACDWLELGDLEDRLEGEAGDGARVLP